MLTLSPETFAKLLNQHAADIRKLIDVDLPKIIGVMARNHFTENFQTESWQRKKWQEVKRRMPTWERNGKTIENPIQGAKRTRAILTGDTGNLGRSIQYDAKTGVVLIYSDLIYAAVHNYGLKAGRGNGFTMPQRQFIGDDPQLIQAIENKINNRLNKIFKS